MIIAIDFDGTLHTGRWPDIGSPAPYAVDMMQKLKADGHYLIIWTCRENRQQTEAINWLLDKQIPFDRINDNVPGQTELYGNNSRKVHAHLYVDDKQVGGLPCWDEIYNEVCLMEANYKAKET
jgi:hydroxymethylpyrimidine pyrophosphatase-like HAD family hydrolase